MKQLNQRPRKRAINRNVNMARSTMGIESVQIPMEVAYSVRQPYKSHTHTETAREYIGNFVISSSTPINSTIIFPMNPSTLAATRLARLAANYQKFRFRRLALTVQSSSTTAANGLYIVGYNANPDASIRAGYEVPSIMALPGSISTNVWRTVTSVARISDSNKWYNVDPDSAELMQTTQGYFAIVLQSVPSITGELVMPVMLDYSVEFTGPALNIFNESPIVIVPVSVFNNNPSAVGYYNATPVAGEIPMPSLSVGVPYRLSPKPLLPLAGEEGGSVFAETITKVDNGSWPYRFSISVANAVNGIFLTNLKDSFQLPDRCIADPISF